MKTMLFIIAFMLCVNVPVAACGPRDTPQLLTAEVQQKAIPRMEFTACENGVLHGANQGDMFYVALGQKLSLSPWMPKGQQKSRGSVVAFSIPIEDSYLTSRKTNAPMLLITAASLEAAEQQIPLVTSEYGGALHEPKKPPTDSGTIRSFQVKDGMVTILTDADFDFGIIWDSATGRKIYELRNVKGE